MREVKIAELKVNLSAHLDSSVILRVQRDAWKAWGKWGATAGLLRERLQSDLIFGTHDQQQARAARGLSFECVES